MKTTPFFYVVPLLQCIRATPACPPGQELHNSKTGVNKCCVPLKCPAGSQAVLCGDRDPHVTCSACSEGSYMPVATPSTQMQSCVIHKICDPSNGLRVENPGTTTRDTDCDCLDDFCPTAEICVPCRGTYHSTESTLTQQMTTIDTIPEEHWKPWKIVVPVITVVGIGTTIAILVYRKRPCKKLPFSVPVADTSESESLRGNHTASSDHGTAARRSL